MPAVVKRTEESPSGTSEDEGTIVCPLLSKNVRNFCLISADCIKSNITYPAYK
jgi:hypothetical protein